ncbi:MAG TPA: DUF1206 domain-containing protein [Ktedonobacterales bacterium]
MAQMEMQAARQIDEAKLTARRAAANPWTTRYARFGYIAKGIVYGIIGALAAKAALGRGGAMTDRNGAIQAIYQQPFGKFLLAIVTIGLFGYALWSWIQAALDTENKGHGIKGVVARLGYAVVGFSYAGLALAALQLVLDKGSGGKSSDANAQDWTARLLHAPFGVALVVLVGFVALGLALRQANYAYTARFKQRLNLLGVSAQARTGIIVLGRWGMAALGVVFAVVGFFLISAALRHDPHQAKGLGGALQTLAGQPFGPFLLGVVAIGLIAYGVYSLVEARYRRMVIV